MKLECKAVPTKEPRTVVYIWPKAESVLDNLQNRRSRPISHWKGTVVPEVLKTYNSEGLESHWDAYAGCQMCPCSPGFILADTISVNGKIVDIHVDLMEES